jgi:hypothetical protein
VQADANRQPDQVSFDERLQMSDTHSYAAETPSRVEPSRRHRLVTIFGDITRGGAWRLSGKTSVVTIFGDIDLDLRHATLPTEGARIGAAAPFGNIDIAVPSGAEVVVGGFTLFGSKKVAVDGAAARDDGAVIRVRGFSLFGSMKVRST